MKIFKLSIIVISLLISACSHFKAEHKAVKPVMHAQTVKLDKEIHQLLLQEMQAIEKGMTGLIPAVARGEWDKVAGIGKNIQQSYLLKQKLTVEQRHSLHKSLPKRFIQLDQAFHESAGMLAHAAEMRKPDIVNFYVYKLSNACVECHSEFATERFPSLTPVQGHKHGH